jgi:aspartokinase
VDGVYTTDPRITDKARKLDRIAFEEMLELAAGRQGAADPVGRTGDALQA